MFSSLFGVFTKVGAWVGAVEGAHFVADKAKEYTASTRVAPIVAGIGDTITTVLDPLDLTGTRKRKEDEQKAREQGLRESVKDQKARLKREAKAKEEQTKRARAAEKKLAEAQKKERELQAKIEKLSRDGRTSEARRLADQKTFSQRWQQLAERTRLESEAVKAKDPEKSEKLASAALELAKLAINPPANAIAAINSEATDAGKSLIASLVDSVNRAEDPNIEALFQRMNAGDQDAIAEYAFDADVEGADHAHGAPTVAGGCCGGPKNQCGACKSGQACAGKTAPVPDAYVSGDGEFDAGTFDEFNSYMNGLDVSGAEPDYVGFMSGASDDDEIGCGSCASGRCAIADVNGAYDDSE